MEQAAGDRGGIAVSLHNLAMVACALGDFQKAEAFYQEALQINRELGRRNLEQHNLIGLGEVAYLQEDYPKARVFYEQGLALSKETGHKGCIANALNGLGKTACRAGDYPAAKARLDELLLCCREINELLNTAQTFRNFAELALAQGDYHRAAVLSGAAESVIRSTGGSPAANEQADHEHYFTTLRQVLDEASFEKAFNTGLILTLDEATEVALSE
jgi:tetratricopeptide (TPR) repeat protein